MVILFVRLGRPTLFGFQPRRRRGTDRRQCRAGTLSVEYNDVNRIRTTNARTLQLQASRSAVTPHTFFLLGLRQQRVPLPPTGCLLLTSTELALPALVDPQGRATLTLPLPPQSRGATIYAQFLEGTAMPQADLWRTSDALRFDQY